MISDDKLRRQGRLPVNPNPQNQREWAAYWRWFYRRYRAIKGWHKAAKRAQMHKFTHMGLEDA